jgi:hypothetical protein
MKDEAFEEAVRFFRELAEIVKEKQKGEGHGHMRSDRG